MAIDAGSAIPVVVVVIVVVIGNTGSSSTPLTTVEATTSSYDSGSRADGSDRGAHVFGRATTATVSRRNR